MTLTLDPVAADWTEEVGVQAVGFFNLVQEFSDIHHLQRHQGAKEYHLDTSLPWFHTFNSHCNINLRLKSIMQRSGGGSRNLWSWKIPHISFQNFSKIVVNRTVIQSWECDFYIAPSLCRRDSWRAPSDGQIQGEGSRTQPECCSRLRPSPSSNWCHCNRDNMHTSKYHGWYKYASLYIRCNLEKWITKGGWRDIGKEKTVSLRTVHAADPVFVFVLSKSQSPHELKYMKCL